MSVCYNKEYHIVYLLFLICFSLLPAPLQAENRSYTIQGVISGYPEQEVYLFAVQGFQEKKIDSTLSSSLGEFSFQLPGKMPSGLYRIRLIDSQTQATKKNDIGILFNKENVVLTTSLDDIFKQLVFYDSQENKVFYEFMGHYIEYYYAIENIKMQLTRTAGKEQTDPSLAIRLNYAQRTFQNTIHQISSEHEGLLAARLIRYYEPPDLTIEELQNGYHDSTREQILKKIDFSDSALAHTDIMISKVAAYLHYFYQGDEVTANQQDSLYKKAVDTILHKGKRNSQNYFILIDFLSTIFEKEKNDTLLSHLARHVQQGTVAPVYEEEHKIAERTLHFLNLQKGNQVIDYVFLDMLSKRTVRLHEIEATHTILLFWSISCDYCIDVIERLHHIYQQTPPEKLAVVAIAVEEKKIDSVKSYLSSQNIRQWVNHADTGNQEHSISKQFNLKYTPTIFMLNRNKVIVSKPEIEDIESMFGTTDQTMQ